MTRSIAMSVLTLALIVSWSGVEAQAGEMKADQVLKVYRTKSLPAGVTKAHETKLTKLVTTLRKGDTTAASAQWEGFCGEYFTAANQGDLAGIEAWVLNHAFLSAFTGGGTTTPTDLGEEIGKWEAKMKAAGDTAQEANSEFQNVLQRQDATLQTMTTVSKMLHDDAMQVIRDAG